MPKYDDKGTLAEQAGLVAKRQDINKPEDSRLTDVNWGDIDPGSIARKSGMDVVTDVVVEDEIVRGRVIGERFAELLNHPLRCRMERDVDVDDSSSVVVDHEPHI